MHFNGRVKLSEFGALKLRAAIRLASILALVIDMKVDKTKMNLLAFDKC